MKDELTRIDQAVLVGLYIGGLVAYLLMALGDDRGRELLWRAL